MNRWALLLVLPFWTCTGSDRAVTCKTNGDCKGAGEQCNIVTGLCQKPMTAAREGAIYADFNCPVRSVGGVPPGMPMPGMPGMGGMGGFGPGMGGMGGLGPGMGGMGGFGPGMGGMGGLGPGMGGMGGLGPGMGGMGGLGPGMGGMGGMGGLGPGPGGLEVLFRLAAAGAGGEGGMGPVMPPDPGEPGTFLANLNVAGKATCGSKDPTESPAEACTRGGQCEVSTLDIGEGDKLVVMLLDVRKGGTKIGTGMLVARESALEGSSGQLSAPHDVFGALYAVKSGTLLPSENPNELAFLFWGGTVTVERFSDPKGRARIKGTIDMDLKEPPSNGSGVFGGECKLSRSCAASSLASERCYREELVSPDCGEQNCLPLNDGTSSGFCNSACETRRDCERFDSKSECVTIPASTVGICQHKCDSDSDCYAAAGFKCIQPVVSVGDIGQKFCSFEGTRNLPPPVGGAGGLGGFGPGGMGGRGGVGGAGGIGGRGGMGGRGMGGMGMGGMGMGGMGMGGMGMGGMGMGGMGMGGMGMGGIGGMGMGGTGGIGGMGMGGTGGTGGMSGGCSVVPQGGCAMGQACYPATGASVCRPAGTTANGAACTSPENCVAGSSCVAMTCRQLCSTTAGVGPACPAGTMCRTGMMGGTIGACL